VAPVPAAILLDVEQRIRRSAETPYLHASAPSLACRRKQLNDGWAWLPRASTTSTTNGPGLAVVARNNSQRLLLIWLVDFLD
jgi:hypothetical protein